MVSTVATIEYSQKAIVASYQKQKSPIFIGIDNPTLTKSTKTTIRDLRPSGIILMSQNIKDETQVKTLIKDIKKYGDSLGIDIKVSVDEEGGQVARLDPLKNYPFPYDGPFTYSKQNDLEVLKEEDQKHAKYLKDLGIDVNFAPVADIAYTKDSIMKYRSGGDTAEEVSTAVNQIIKDQKENKISSTLKHYPGHGKTETDSHEALPVINQNKEEWLSSDAQPFISGINNDVEYIMTGHILNPSISREPASLSKEWINEILREELNFKGKVITDDLKMSGLAKQKGTIKCAQKKDVKYKNNNQNTDYALKIHNSLSAGNNYALLILPEKDMRDVYKEWIKIEKKCI